MRRSLVRLVSATCLAALASAPVLAADVAAPGDRFSGFRFFDEVRVGLHAHNPGHDEGDSFDVSGQILTSPIFTAKTGNAFADFFLNPRFHVGAMVNTRGWTNYVYSGMTWRADLTEKIFAELEFGAAVNDSPSRPTPNRVDIGCSVTFHETAGLGYRFTDRVSLLLDVDHISHASLCGGHNPGLTNVGLKLGYRF